MTITVVGDGQPGITSGGGEQTIKSITAVGDTAYVLQVDWSNLVGVEQVTIKTYVDCGTSTSVLFRSDVIVKGTDPSLFISPPIIGRDGYPITWKAVPSGWAADRYPFWVLYSL